MPAVERDPALEESDAQLQSRARALASPLRMRILRLALHEARTNKELADELGVNPGTLLHHVRSLVANGFLRAEEPRRGARGSREVPYRATGLSWTSDAPASGRMLVDTFLQEIEGLAVEDLNIIRLGVKFNQATRDEMMARFGALFQEYKEREPDADGRPLSLMFAEHPEISRAQRLGRPRT
ncbi:MAG: ArsR family transcriptional regulator [Glaciihabitans sp.]|jgi:DNA-binding transcriptional ArsR family regulator|nr:ArsR family transcriptional regulator [Glaciihabitans sp.]